MANQGAIGFLVFYVVFFTTIAYYGTTFDFVPAVATFGDNPNTIDVSGDIETPPSLSDYGSDIGALDYLDFVFEILAYFFTLQGLTIAGLSVGITSIISIAMNVTLVYIILSLARGGS